MVTDRDIAIRLVARGLDARQARVEDFMTGKAYACHEDDSIGGCMELMSRYQIRRLPIVNDRQRIVGIISQSDLARHAEEHLGTGERRAVADMLCAVSESDRLRRQNLF